MNDFTSRFINSGHGVAPSGDPFLMPKSATKSATKTAQNQAKIGKIRDSWETPPNWHKNKKSPKTLENKGFSDYFWQGH